MTIYYNSLEAAASQYPMLYLVDDSHIVFPTCILKNVHKKVDGLCLETRLNTVETIRCKNKRMSTKIRPWELLPDYCNITHLLLSVLSYIVFESA